MKAKPGCRAFDPLIVLPGRQTRPDHGGAARTAAWTTRTPDRSRVGSSADAVDIEHGLAQGLIVEVKHDEDGDD